MKKYLLVFVVLLMFSPVLVMVNAPIKAQEPYVKVYVHQPLGYIPGVPIDGRVTVDIIIEVSGIIDDSPEGIRGWGMDVSVDPDVLEPVTVEGDGYGYFLYEYCPDPWYIRLFPGTPDPTTGYWDGILEILPPGACPGVGAGDSYSGWKLVTLIFRSKSDVEHSLIDLMNVEYLTADGVWHPVDEAIDGIYNSPPVPEFPIGLALEILFIPVIIYIFWRSRLRKKKR